MTTAESPYPIRNVPSIIYTNPPNASSTTELLSVQNKSSVSEAQPIPTDVNEKIPDTLYTPITQKSNPSLLLPNNTITKTREPKSRVEKKYVKDTDDYIFQVYIGSLSIVGLFILFRLIQKS